MPTLMIGKRVGWRAQVFLVVVGPDAADGPGGEGEEGEAGHDVDGRWSGGSRPRGVRSRRRSPKSRALAAVMPIRTWIAL